MNSQNSCGRHNIRSRKHATDFSKIGGLSNHIRILRDTIIVPLLHNNVYSHFNVKTPRGLLFYGPPGTGKTLMAGALATELNREGIGKVTFYQRKGVDVLDKWFGESERKLNSLFEEAAKNRPSIIFFDEIDGLVPIRNCQQEHVHYSIVTTLLALMDGLDSVPGVIVIGATNKIEAVDPALRRSGRFDKELYFPLPSKEARKEILQVHVISWKHKPSEQFFTNLAELTTGFCGADLQALCAEAVLCAMKRCYPNYYTSARGGRLKIEASELKITEDDFISAGRSLVPLVHKLSNRIRKMSSIVAPLLERQIETILLNIRKLAPHFFVQFYEYVVGRERYIGRIVLIGNSLQGLNEHIVPAILQAFEHLPVMFLEAATLENKAALANFFTNVPSILVIPLIDELWSCLESYDQNYITSLLKDTHSGLPILIITTVEEEMPPMLQNFFYNKTSIIINIENPNEREVEEFFIPLFFGESRNSLSYVLLKQKKDPRMKSDEPRWETSSKIYNLRPSSKISKSPRSLKRSVRMSPDKDVKHGDNRELEKLYTLRGSSEKKKQLSQILTGLLQRGIAYLMKMKPSNGHTSAHRRIDADFGNSNDLDKQKIYDLWRRIVSKTAKDMPVSQLEVLYDTVFTCINMNRGDFRNLIKNLEETLSEYETSND